MNPRISVCITTHNRREELARTLRQLGSLNPAPVEVLVLADGCEDGTAAMLRDVWPTVRLIEHTTAKGSIPSRNELAQAATGDILLSLDDDDSYPMGSDFVARLRQVFVERPGVAVVFLAQRTDEFPESLCAESLGSSAFVGSFANSAAAIRRVTFLELGGYPAFFGHAYEEPDFALRCIAAGWQVWHDSSLVVRHHFTAVQRNELRTHQRHSRNEFWSVLLRCPFPQVLGVAGFRVVRQAGYARKRALRWLLSEPAWWRQAIAGIPLCLRQRDPLPWPTYLRWMQLIRHPIADEMQWQEQFGTLQSTNSR